MNIRFLSPLMGGQESNGSDAAPEPPAQPPTPVAVNTLVEAARRAEKSIDRFVQLHDPRGSDLKALEDLRAALGLFGGVVA